MISAIVLGNDSTTDRDDVRESTVRSLIWLVSAAVAGVVRDVTLAGAPSAAVRDIAEQAGCEIVESDREGDRLAAALQIVRCERVLVLRAGFQPEGPLLEDITAWDRGRPDDKTTLVLAAPKNAFERLFANRGEIVGILAHRQRVAGFSTFHALARSYRRSPRLRARVRPILTGS